MGKIKSTTTDSQQQLRELTREANGAAKGLRQALAEQRAFYQREIRQLTDAALAEVRKAAEALDTEIGQRLAEAHQAVDRRIEYFGNDLHDRVSNEVQMRWDEIGVTIARSLDDMLKRFDAICALLLGKANQEETPLSLKVALDVITEAGGHFVTTTRKGQRTHYYLLAHREEDKPGVLRVSAELERHLEANPTIAKVLGVAMALERGDHMKEFFLQFLKLDHVPAELTIRRDI
jgi:hypothetical protein